MTSFELALVLLAASVAAVAVLRAVRMPPLLAFLLVGVVLGPFAGRAMPQAPALDALGHVGVVFLMFSIGLEFNLGKLSAMRRDVLGLGGAQVLLTVAAALLAWALVPAAAIELVANGPVDWRGALVLGGAMAMSSTALVAKLLAERREVETDHGRRIFAVLLFQDLAVVPLLVLIPALTAGAGRLAADLAWAAAKAALLLFVLLRAGRPALRAWFQVVARRRSHELFSLNVLLVTLTMAWLTQWAGLSLELGAFVAGVLIAETEYRWQVEEDIKPFRDLLLGLFFIALGLKLDLGVVVDHAWQVALLTVVPMVGKFVLVAVLARRFGVPHGGALRTALWLAQAGEFGFVVLAQAVPSGLVAPGTAQVALAAMLVSLLLSPVLLHNADRILLRVSASEWMLRSLQLSAVAARSMKRERHVIVCGFGRSGQGVAHVLEAEKIAYVALDLDPDRVRAATEAGEPVVYGDATRRETLVAAGVHRAVALVISFDDAHSAMRLLALVQSLAPKLPVIVRASGDGDLDRLRAAGAAEVVPEVVEGALMLASHALALSGVPLARVLRRIRDVRHDQYALLRGFFHGADDPDDAIEARGLRLETVSIESGSPAVGRSLAEIGLRTAGVHVTALRRSGARSVEPGDDTRLEAGDAMVLAGTVEALATARDRIGLGGPAESKRSVP